MRPIARRTLATVVPCAILLTAAIEAWFGRPELLGDDICYLDVANLVRAGDWKAALNPLWSLGYPLLLAVFRPLFGPSMHGELLAIFWLNLAICLASWLCFAWLVRVMLAVATAHPAQEPLPALAPVMLLAAALIFLGAELGLGRVSSVGPDQLVTCLFFAGSALALRFAREPTLRRGIALGAVLGAGYLAKAVFLPLGAILLATALAGSLTQRRSPSDANRPRIATLLAAPAVFFLLVALYALPISWALGRPTLGESGALNYAFHVNQLPHWMGWEGSPADPSLGTPVHPLPLVLSRPPVFAFPEPFHVTYPPDYAMVYWYDGFRHPFNPRQALAAFAVNQRILLGLVHTNEDVVLAIALCGAFALALRPRRRRAAAGDGWTRSARRTWPLFVPPLLGVFLYLQVHLESRYIAPFIAVLAILPVLALNAGPSPDKRGRHPRLAAAQLALLAVTVGWQLWIDHNPAIRVALSGADFEQQGQWRVARALTAAGLPPGARVASVADHNDIRCTWAYAARLHIVAHIGNDAYDPEPADQLRDLHLFFDHPEIQTAALAAFRRAGAAAVVAPDLPFPVPSPGWQSIPGTHAWFLKL